MIESLVEVLLGAALFFIAFRIIRRIRGRGVAMPLTEAQKRAKAKHEKRNVTVKRVSFYPADAGLLAWDEGRGEPFATYMKRLIREDMERAE